jgi:hypothetical protein
MIAIVCTGCFAARKLRHKGDHGGDNHDAVEAVVDGGWAQQESGSGQHRACDNQNIPCDLACTPKQSGSVKKQDRRNGDNVVDAGPQARIKPRLVDRNLQQLSLDPEPDPIKNGIECEIEQQRILLASQRGESRRDHADCHERRAQEQVGSIAMKGAQHLGRAHLRSNHAHG